MGHPRSRINGVLLVTCISSLVVNANSSAMTILLPEVSTDTNTPIDVLQWAITGYALVGAATIVTAGALGDIFGRRRIFLGGLALFVASCVLIALADSGMMVIIGRCIQGAAGSTLLACGMSLISTANTGSARIRAVALWGASAAIGAAVGPVIGGLLATFTGWQGLFWIDAMIAAACVPIVMRSVIESYDPNRPRSIDFAGMFLLAATLAPLILALTEGPAWGLLSAPTLACIGISVAAIVGFVLVEKHSSAPLVDLALLRNRVLVGSTIAILIASGAINAIMYVVSLYFQSPDALGMSSLKAGFAILPVAAVAVVLAPFVTPIVGSLGVRRTVLMGAIFLTLSFTALTFITSSWTYLAFLLPLAAIAVGMSLQNNPASAASTGCVPPEQVGVASGISNMARYVGISIMTAVVASIYSTVTANQVAAGASQSEALSLAMSRSSLALAIWCALGIGVVILISGRRQKRPTQGDYAAATANATHTVPTP